MMRVYELPVKGFFTVQKPYWELVSLMELLEFHAEPFYRLSGMIGQLISRLDSRDPSLLTYFPEFGGSTLGEMQREIERLELPNSRKQILRIREWIFNPRPEGLDYQEMSRQMKELHTRVMDELEDQLLLVVPGKRKEDFKQTKPLFGADVEAKFPQMSEDIAEAGKCLALGRPTAAVFHLMRVMEISVQKLGAKVGIPLVGEKVWQVILDGINKAIRAMDQKAPQTKAYAETATHLYNVKLAWRNEVMHPKQTYTDEEAMKIFDNVKTFVADIVPLV